MKTSFLPEVRLAECGVPSTEANHGHVQLPWKISLAFEVLCKILVWEKLIPGIMEPGKCLTIHPLIMNFLKKIQGLLDHFTIVMAMVFTKLPTMEKHGSNSNLQFQMIQYP